MAELTNVSKQSNTNELFLNVKKTKYSSFHKLSKKYNIQLRLPNLNMCGLTVERESSTKFLGIWIDENLTWRDYFHIAENKVPKNIGLLYQRSITSMLDEYCLKQIYFVYIHAYLNYANIAWVNTHKTKLKEVLSCLAHQFLLNKLLSTTNVLKNYTVFNISQRSNSLEQLPFKN